MSNSTDTFPALSGGVPTTSQDYGASIVFTIAFIALLIPAIYRICSGRSRSLILIRPIIFLLAQIAAYGLRAAIAHGSTSTKVYEASEILLLAGFILICEPIPALLGRVVGNPKTSPWQGPKVALFQRILALLRVALVVALIMGILAALDVGSNESQSTRNDIKTYRLANAALVIGSIGGSAVLAVGIFQHGLLFLRAAFWFLVVCILIVITAIYKLITTSYPPNNYSLVGKVIFYILNSAVQWLITALYFAFNLNELFVQDDGINADLEVQRVQNYRGQM